MKQFKSKSVCRFGRYVGTGSRKCTVTEIIKHRAKRLYGCMVAGRVIRNHFATSKRMQNFITGTGKYYRDMYTITCVYKRRSSARKPLLRPLSVTCSEKNRPVNKVDSDSRWPLTPRPSASFSSSFNWCYNDGESFRYRPYVIRFVY